MKNPPRGKIGRLSQAIQEQVNRRLEHGERARTLVAWLNAQPEVQAILAAEFAGKPIREQNLSEWRQHGYQKWLEKRQCLAMAQEMNSTPNQPVTDNLAGWATAHYLYAIRKLMDTSPGGQPDFKTLRAFLHDVVSVRRGDHSAIRLQLVSERLADKRQETTGVFAAPVEKVLASAPAEPVAARAESKAHP
jgi:hypothetical protein